MPRRRRRAACWDACGADRGRLRGARGAPIFPPCRRSFPTRSPTPQTLIFVLAVSAGGLLLERLRPAQRGQPWAHVGFNLLYTLPFVFLTHLLVPPLAALTQHLDPFEF